MTKSKNVEMTLKGHKQQ